MSKQCPEREWPGVFSRGKNEILNAYVERIMRHFYEIWDEKSYPTARIVLAAIFLHGIKQNCGATIAHLKKLLFSIEPNEELIVTVVKRMFDNGCWHNGKVVWDELPEDEQEASGLIEVQLVLHILCAEGTVVCDNEFSKFELKGKEKLEAVAADG